MESDEPFPLVDVSSLELDVSKDDLRRIGDQIVEGFKQTGYVYLKNHGVSNHDIESFIGATNTFFELDEETKNKYKGTVHTDFHGYSEKQATFDSSRSPQSTASRRSFCIYGIDKLHIFPDKEVPELRSMAKKIIDKIQTTALRILSCLELGLDMKDGTLINSHKLMMKKGNSTDMRFVRYLPPEQDERIRLQAHCDFCTFTFHLYGDMEGLEFLDKDGVWQKWKTYSGYILLIPGEIIQLWTGNQIKAMLHRVVIPEDEETRKRPRHALMTFIHPDADTVIGTFEGSDECKPITAREFSINRFKFYAQTG